MFSVTACAVEEKFLPEIIIVVRVIIFFVVNKKKNLASIVTTYT